MADRFPGPALTHRPIVLDMLRAASGAVVSRHAIARKLYGRTNATEAQLGSMRCMIRRLREQERGSAKIVTVPGKGYRLITGKTVQDRSVS